MKVWVDGTDLPPLAGSRFGRRERRTTHRRCRWPCTGGSARDQEIDYRAPSGGPPLDAAGPPSLLVSASSRRLPGGALDLPAPNRHTMLRTTLRGCPACGPARRIDGRAAAALPRPREGGVTP